MNHTLPQIRRSYRAMTALSATATLMALALVAGGPLGAAAATPFGTNLVRNPGASDGLDHWETFAGFRTKAYGAAGLGFPSTSTSAAIGGGKRFFYAGPYDTGLGTCGNATQQWRLQGIGGAIDSGGVKVVLKGYLGTNGSSDITAHLDLFFRDGENHQVASNGILRSASGTNEQLLLVKGAKVLPKRTRILRLKMRADGDATITSGDCQAFWDKLSVTLKRV